MTAVARTIAAGPLDAASWAPFGWLPVPDTDPSDGSQRLHFEWADPHVNVISHAADEVVHLEGGLLCERMYRHDTHTQALLALDGPSVIAVAPADVRFEGPGGPDEPALAAVRAFVLRPLDALVLHRGTWHWGPFPLGEAPVHLYNVQGLGYRDDNASVDLTGLGLAIEVQVPG
ncbi:MAG TPA: ureidoglycolate lyase [Acidimicrobiales bacterium]|nr:ureidoglycolate lyase [Acidimicrobiales bacterium]